MHLKKIPYYFLLSSLTLGASLIIGLLSFGGLYALWPNLILSSIAFILSVAYEGEIYLQNIKGALNKILKPQAITIEYAKTFLKNYFPHHYPYSERPLFFLEYEYALHELHAFEHQELTTSTRIKKREIEDKLKKLEKKFCKIIQIQEKNPKTLSRDDLALLKFLQHYRLATPRGQQSHVSLNQEFQSLLQHHHKFNQSIRYFSLLTAIFMSFGTSYLLVEAFAIVPFMLALPIAAPLLIIPMAVISGIAYGLLTYNTLTNIVIHDRIRTRIQKLQKNYEKNGFTWRNTLMIASSVILGSLAIILTLCTAGTWWTIIKNTPPLFRSIRKIPSTIFGIIIPFITGIAALAFNLENSTESLEIIDELLEEKRDWKTDWDNLRYRLEKQWARENILQRLNPFRLFLITIMAPLRFVLFLGHLISIGVTSDRVPGLSQIFSAFLGVVSEFFEDGHYFIKNRRHQHDPESLVKERLSGSDHSHEDDLPSRLLKFLATPIYLLSSIWNYITSQLNTDQENRLNINHIAHRNEIQPKISLQHALKAEPQEKNLPMQVKNQGVTQQQKKSASTPKSVAPVKETPASTNCPCCPALGFYQNFIAQNEIQNQTQPILTVPTPLGNKDEGIVIETKQIEKNIKPKTDILKAQIPASLKHPFFSTEYCTVLPVSANSAQKRKRPLKSTHPKAALNPTDEILPEMPKPLHFA